MPAILFGSIGTIADTSELQRQSFNKAFALHNLQWQWSRAEYISLLEKSGGILPSNSAKSSPWENSYQESFYGKFKPELELHKLPKNSNIIDIYNYISNQIDYYNNYRIHTTHMDIPTNARKEYFRLKNQVKTEENLVYQELVA